MLASKTAFEMASKGINANGDGGRQVAIGGMFHEPRRISQS